MAIDADALIECLQTWKTVAVSEGLPINERFATAMIAQVNLMPTIEERKTGEWMVDPDGRLHCSRCLENPTNRVMIDGRLVYDMTPIVGKMRYCPNCGSYNGG